MMYCCSINKYLKFLITECNPYVYEIAKIQDLVKYKKTNLGNLKKKIFKPISIKIERKDWKL
jgi:hypothetical protein